MMLYQGSSSDLVIHAGLDFILPVILQVLEEISSENNPQRAVEAKVILAQMDVSLDVLCSFERL